MATNKKINKHDAPYYAEYTHARDMFVYEMVKIKQLNAQGRSPLRTGYEIGRAFIYYEEIVLSKYLDTEKNLEKLLALCMEYDHYLDAIMPLRKTFKG